MMGRYLWLVLALSVSGCANLRGSSATAWPWSEKPVCPNMAACTSGDALAAFVAATEFCRRVHNYYEAGGRRSDNSQFGIGTAGVLAGSVLAPISKGTAAKAWSGLSGAANAVQLSLEETFSTSLAIRRSVAVADAAKGGSDMFKTAQGKTNDDKVIAAVDMARLCAMAAGQADADAIRSITGQGGRRDAD